MNQTIPTVLEDSTGNLRLRPLRRDDAETLARLTAVPAVRSCSRLVPKEAERGETQKWIERLQQSASGATEQTWVAETVDRGIVVGLARLRLAPAHANGELDFWIGEPFRRQGHGRVVLRTMLIWAFRQGGLHRLEMRHVTTEFGAESLALSLGFTPEGIARHAWRLEGNFCDVAQYGILSSDDFPEE